MSVYIQVMYKSKDEELDKMRKVWNVNKFQDSHLPHGGHKYIPLTKITKPAQSEVKW